MVAAEIIHTYRSNKGDGEEPKNLGGEGPWGRNW